MNKTTDKKQTIVYFTIFVILFALVILPVIAVFSEAVIVDGRFDFSNALRTVIDKENLTTITNSLLLGVLVVIVSTIISTPLALLLARTRYARWKWLDVVLMIPFMTPPYISSMGWILFMQKRGLFQQLFPWTGSVSESFFSLGGLVLVMSFHVSPFMTTMLKNAILNIGMNLEESAAVSGAGFLYRLRRVMLPLLTGNYAIAMLLVFVKTLSEYGTPSTLGNRIGFYVLRRIFTDMRLPRRLILERRQVCPAYWSLSVWSCGWRRAILPQNILIIWSAEKGKKKACTAARGRQK